MNNDDLSKALCKKMGLETSLFFEDFEEMSVADKKKVIAICNKCDVKKECREAGASQRDGYGVWGGVFYKKGRIVRTYAAPKKRTQS